MDERFGARRTSGHINIHWHYFIDTLDDGVVVKAPPQEAQSPMAMTHFGFWHLVVQSAQNRRHLA